MGGGGGGVVVIFQQSQCQKIFPSSKQYKIISPFIAIYIYIYIYVDIYHISINRYSAFIKAALFLSLPPPPPLPSKFTAPRTEKNDRSFVDHVVKRAREPLYF